MTWELNVELDGFYYGTYGVSNLKGTVQPGLSICGPSSTPAPATVTLTSVGPLHKLMKTFTISAIRRLYHRRSNT